MTKLAVRLPIALVLVSLVAAPALAGTNSKVEIVNRSDWDIHELYFSPVDEDDWGPDQLGEQVIASGESFTLTKIPCDHYDIQVVDEDGDSCVLANVDLCSDSATWVIDNDELLGCLAESE